MMKGATVVHCCSKGRPRYEWRECCGICTAGGRNSCSANKRHAVGDPTKIATPEADRKPIVALTANALKSEFEKCLTCP
jgi:hypothetical protein